jgi:hypothetical protein
METIKIEKNREFFSAYLVGCKSLLTRSKQEHRQFLKCMEVIEEFAYFTDSKSMLKISCKEKPGSYIPIKITKSEIMFEKVESGNYPGCEEIFEHNNSSLYELSEHRHIKNCLSAVVAVKSGVFISDFYADLICDLELDYLYVKENWGVMACTNIDNVVFRVMPCINFEKYLKEV